MKTIPVLAVLACAGVLPAAAQQRDLRFESGGEHRVALVIGNNGYPRAPLKNAVNDALAISRTLRELGFEVDTLTDANGQAMDQAIDRLTRKLRTGDVALFYFAGHGVQIDGNNYLIPVDFAGDQPSDVKYKAVAGPWVVERLDATGARLKMIILDACRNNPFRGARALSGGLGQMSAARGSFIAFATGPGQVANDGAGANGLFTEELVSAIRMPGLSLDDVFTRVREAVDRRSGGQQLPWTSSSVVGRFSFRTETTAPVSVSAPIAAPRPIVTAPATRDARIRRNAKDGLKYVWVAPGSFRMGCSQGDSECYPNEVPVHSVEISSGYWIGQTEVTVAAYRRFADATATFFPAGLMSNRRDGNPVTGTTWADARKYCEWAGLRLPTEAEWEFAARGSDNRSRHGTPNEVAWWMGNSGRAMLDDAAIPADQGGRRELARSNGNQVHPVAQKTPNGLELYDTLGNVWEWVQDWYKPAYYSEGVSKDPQGPPEGNDRVLRGGSWAREARAARVSHRGWGVPDARADAFGFRCAGPALPE